MKSPQYGAAAVMISLLAGGVAWASPNAADFDKDGDGRLTGGEATAYELHLVFPILEKYDLDFNGVIGDAEVAAMNAAFLRKEIPADRLGVVAPLEEALRERGFLSVEELTSGPAKSETDPCGSAGRLYVRRDPMEIDGFTGNVAQEEAKGASLSLSNESVSGYSATEIHGVLAYAFGRKCFAKPTSGPDNALFMSSRSFAAFIHADGVRTNDDSDKDKSSLRFGLDAQIALNAGRWFETQFFTASPYVMTDFRGEARAYGMEVSWQPYQADWHLGYFAKQPDKYLDAFWELRAEADWLHVDEVGLTDLEAGTDYAWVGGVLGATAFFFPERLNHRIKAYGSWTYHRDVNQGLDARLYGLGAAYDLTEDGAIAVSLDYSWGLERDKLIEVDRTTLSLNFKH